MVSFITAVYVTRCEEVWYDFDKSSIEKTILDQIMGYHFLKNKDVKQENPMVFYIKIISKSVPEVGVRLYQCLLKALLSMPFWKYVLQH